mmetsp:Transcript_9985/g.14827  ORF Transcript_9985/g.14827 Transcript_9985/m.14827 type:complete len:395 (+) Transcript_9985:46-1230(+)
MDPLIIQLGILGVICVCLAGIFENHPWRIAIVIFQYVVSGIIKETTSSSLTGTVLQIITTFVILKIPMFANWTYLKREGCVMVTGCDSGMGQATVVYLAETNGKENNSYDQIFAACFNAKASQAQFEKLLTSEQLKYVTVLPLDVTNDQSVEQAKSTVEQWMKNKASKAGLTGLVQFHGVAFNGPAAYMPMQMYERQIQVNFLGYVRVVQIFLPIMKKAKSGRMIFTGTGGGPCTPCPALLTAYMSSKFATEAYCHSLRSEFFMTNTNIEACMINPGFVKPTMLMEEGKKLTEKMWKDCEDKLKSSIAKDEYGPLFDHFLKYSALQPGTHVVEVSKAAEHALLAKVPRTSYKVGIDSKLAPIVGMMPTGVRELIARHGIYGVLSPAGTVKGYRV